MNSHRIIEWILATALVITAAPFAAAANTASNPRQAMQEYLTACREGDYERGAQYLDLSGTRAERGPRLARQLKIVLDQTLWVELEGLSDQPEGKLDDDLPPHQDLVGTIQAQQRAVDVLLERRGDTWRVARATVAQISALDQEFGFGPLGNVLPPSMFKRYGDLELWQWTGLIAALLLAYTLGLLFEFIMERTARRLVGRTETNVDDEVLHVAAGPLTATLTVGLFYIATRFLALPVPAQKVATGFCKLGVVLSLTWLAMRLVDVITHVIETRVTQSGVSTALTVVPVARRVVKLFLIIIAVLSGLQNMGYNVTGLLAGLGIVGLGVGLAAQKTFENFFGAISILSDRPVQRGDFCRFGDKIGTIEDIGLRSTRIRTLDRTVVTVPNGEFSTLQLENFAARNKILFKTVLGLRYETSADQLRHLLIAVRRLLIGHPKVDAEPARVRFVQFGAFSLDLEIFSYVNTADWNEFLAIREDLLLRIIDIVEASGTGFAFPSQTLYLGKDDGLDETRTREAEQQVEAWRKQKALNLPDVPQAEQRELRASLDYPEAGSSLALPRSGAGDHD